MPNTIALKFSGRYDEGRAGGAIKPGHLIMLNGSNNVVVQTADGTPAQMHVAWEDALQGKTIDDAYASGDLVPFGICVPGDEVQLILKDEENVDEGDKLVSNGDGCVRKLNAAADPAETPIAEVREALNLTGASGDAFVKARAL